MNLIFINGTMGVGKTTVCRALQKKLPPCVFADGDDFWNMYPFLVNEQTKKMVLDNAGAALSNFIQSGQFKNILFCWVMHEKSIIKELLARIPSRPLRFFLFTLTADKKIVEKRLRQDIDAGRRSEGVLARSEERAQHYREMLSYKIDTTLLSAEGAADLIAATVAGKTGLLPYKETRRLTKAGRAVREEVFMQEQGFAGEFDARDEDCTHMVFYKGGEPAACCRYFATDQPGVFAVGRIAVRKKFRGLGYGRTVLRAAEACARREGAKAMTLSAQVRAQGFYERCGYTAEGAEYEEEGVPHITMRKKILFLLPRL